MYVSNAQLLIRQLNRSLPKDLVKCQQFSHRIEYDKGKPIWIGFFFPDKMAIKLNMFYKFMEHRILSNMDGHLVVTVDWDG